MEEVKDGESQADYVNRRLEADGLSPTTPLRLDMSSNIAKVIDHAAHELILKWSSGGVGMGECVMSVSASLVRTGIKMLAAAGIEQDKILEMVTITTKATCSGDISQVVAEMKKVQKNGKN